jgi:hypothetical protein
VTVLGEGEGEGDREETKRAFHAVFELEHTLFSEDGPRAVGGRYRKHAAQANWRCASCPHLQPWDAPSLLPRPDGVPRARRNTSCCVMPGPVAVCCMDCCSRVPRFEVAAPFPFAAILLDFHPLQPLFLQPVTFSRVRAVLRQRDKSQSQCAPDINYSKTNTHLIFIAHKLPKGQSQPCSLVWAAHFDLSFSLPCSPSPAQPSSIIIPPPGLWLNFPWRWNFFF